MSLSDPHLSVTDAGDVLTSIRLLQGVKGLHRQDPVSLHVFLQPGMALGQGDGSRESMRTVLETHAQEPGVVLA